MARPIVVVLWGVVVFQALAAAAFAFQLPPAATVWPFPDSTPLTFLFIGSIFAAAAASTAWCLIADEPGALVGIALDYLAIFVPMTLFGLAVGITQDRFPVAVFGLACAGGVVFGAWLLGYARRFRIRDDRPLPRLIGWSFVGFVIALVGAGAPLLIGLPDIVPWPVTRDLSVVTGLIFLGAAVYFAYTLARPSVGNAGGQLAGFLAYDLVLIAPFATRLGDIAPNFRFSLIAYTLVVTYSGILAALALARWWTRRTAIA